tara:strand:+ start:13848 stop:14495 length:648 start_codon:yes stop_codon:yes gene_type:complete
MPKKEAKDLIPNNKLETWSSENSFDLDVLRDTHDSISKKVTSPLYVQKRQGPGGTTLDYVDEGYMRQTLNTYYPIWSWEIVKYEFLGKEAIAVHGKLKIVDNGVPRTFDAIAAHRVAVNKTSGDYVDLGNDMKSANTEAFKVACNRLCNIADDVYRKAILSPEQVDTLEGVLGMLDGQTRRKVKESVGNNTINPSNFDSTMEKLKKLTKKDKESK